jgi:hypothetical protein
VEAVLDGLAERNLVTRASQPKKGWTRKAPSLGLRPEAARKVLDELRLDLPGPPYLGSCNTSR